MIKNNDNLMYHEQKKTTLFPSVTNLTLSGLHQFNSCSKRTWLTIFVDQGKKKRTHMLYSKFSIHFFLEHIVHHSALWSKWKNDPVAKAKAMSVSYRISQINCI